MVLDSRLREAEGVDAAPSLKLFILFPLVSSSPIIKANVFGLHSFNSFWICILFNLCLCVHVVLLLLLKD